jgi:hypothetical protein
MHLEALTKEAKGLVGILSEFDSFYLAGGTALALQIGHRISVDFDLFSDVPIGRDLLKQAEQRFGVAVSVLQSTSDELTFLAKGVKITFLAYPFKRVRPLVKQLGYPAMLSVQEIAATKAYVLGRRGEYKDYVDLYFCLAKGHTTLKEILSLAEKKYGDLFNDRLFLEQLVYFGDLEESKIRYLQSPVGLSTLLEFFQRAVKQIKI